MLGIELPIEELLVILPGDKESVSVPKYQSPIEAVFTIRQQQISDSRRYLCQVYYLTNTQGYREWTSSLVIEVNAGEAELQKGINGLYEKDLVKPPSGALTLDKSEKQILNTSSPQMKLKAKSDPFRFCLILNSSNSTKK